MVRVAGYTASQFTRPLGDWAYKQGYDKIATISQDYTFGHEQCGGFCQVFTEAGGEIVTAVLASAEHGGLQPLSRPARQSDRSMQSSRWRPAPMPPASSSSTRTSA